MVSRTAYFRLLAGLVVAFVLLVGLNAVLSYGQGLPSVRAAAATQEEGTDAGDVAPRATDTFSVSAITTTFTMTDFDNQIFVLSPAVRPERFVDCVDNPYYPMIPGTVYKYQSSQTEEGVETTTVTVTNQITEIMGIDVTVLHDSVWLDGELAEDTYDWYAQDLNGNVWYFGEETYEYENGQKVSSAGAWKAGVDGAVPGIIMLRHPVVGDAYREEYYAGEATDMASILSLSASASVPFGDFDGALRTANYNPLDGELENKWYEPGLGLVKELVPATGATVELVGVEHDPALMATDNPCGTSEMGLGWVGTVRATGGPENWPDLALIDVAAAEQVVMHANPDGQITETLLAQEHGFLVYEVTLNNGSEFVIDAGDGMLLEADFSEVAQHRVNADDVGTN